MKQQTTTISAKDNTYSTLTIFDLLALTAITACVCSLGKNLGMMYPLSTPFSFCTFLQGIVLLLAIYTAKYRIALCNSPHTRVLAFVSVLVLAVAHICFQIVGWEILTGLDGGIGRVLLYCMIPTVAILGVPVLSFSIADVHRRPYPYRTTYTIRSFKELLLGYPIWDFVSVTIMGEM